MLVVCYFPTWTKDKLQYTAGDCSALSYCSAIYSGRMMEQSAAKIYIYLFSFEADKLL